MKASVLLVTVLPALVLLSVGARAQSCDPDSLLVPERAREREKTALLGAIDTLFASSVLDAGRAADLAQRIDRITASGTRSGLTWRRLAGTVESLGDLSSPQPAWDTLRVRVDAGQTRAILDTAARSLTMEQRFPNRPREDIAYNATKQLARSLDVYRSALLLHLDRGLDVQVRRDSLAMRDRVDRLYGEYLAVKQTLAREDAELTCYFRETWAAWFLLPPPPQPPSCCSRWSRTRSWTAAVGGIAAVTAVIIHHRRRGRAQGALDVRVSLPR